MKKRSDLVGSIVSLGVAVSLVFFGFLLADPDSPIDFILAIVNVVVGARYLRSWEVANRPENATFSGSLK